MYNNYWISCKTYLSDICFAENAIEQNVTNISFAFICRFLINFSINAPNFVVPTSLFSCLTNVSKHHKQYESLSVFSYLISIVYTHLPNKQCKRCNMHYNVWKLNQVWLIMTSTRSTLISKILKTKKNFV